MQASRRTLVATAMTAILVALGSQSIAQEPQNPLPSPPALKFCLQGTDVDAPVCFTGSETPTSTLTCHNDILGRRTCYLRYMQDGKMCTFSDRADAPVCTDAELFAEQQKRLQQELQRRADEARERLRRLHEQGPQERTR